MNSNPAKVIYLGMTADIMHPGLINIINEASKYGEVLVGLLTDAAITHHKRMPYLTYEQRKMILENVKNISKVVPQEEWSYVPNLLKYKPDFIIHGDDWLEGPLKEVRDEVVKTMAQIGGSIIEIPYTKGINSSSLDHDIKVIGTTPDVRLKSLRRLIQAKPLVRIMEAHNGLCGLIIENLAIQKDNRLLSFDGIWSSSLTDSTSKGKPDIEAVDLTTRLQDINNILECTTKPIIFDGDTGGKPEHFAFTVRTLERNGISAIIIEDKVGLKKNSLFGTEVTQQQATIEEFCDKIETGKKAAITDDFMIIARIESLICGGTVSDAFERSLAYIGAGADGIMIHSKDKSGADIKEFCRLLRQQNDSIPIVVVPTSYNSIYEADLISWGANIVIYANHMLRAAYPAMVKAATSILENQRSAEANDICMPIKQILELIPGTK